MKVLIKPLVTEKLTSIGEKFNRVGFVVDKRANKIEIKDAVESIYNVSVQNVRTMNYAGKAKSRFTKAGAISGKTNDFKKAIVQLSEGDTIDFYSNI